MITIERKIRKISNIFGLYSFFFVFFILFQQVFVTDGHKNRNDDAPYGYSKAQEVAVDAVEIPYPVEVGQSVQLKCIWRVGSKEFYSVRWFKDGAQFYTIFRDTGGMENNVEGLRVNIKESDEHVVTLSNITPTAQGIYKCEVLTDGPPFIFGVGKANLTVVKLPEVPQILGLKRSYLVGDTLNVTCRATNGRPAPQLIFKLNDVQIEGSGRLTTFPVTAADSPELYTSETRLEIPLSENLLPEFNLSCYAYTHGLYVHTDERVHVTQRRSFLSSFFSTAGKTKGDALIVPYCILILKILNYIKFC